MLSGPTYLTPTQMLTLAPLGSIPRSDVPGPYKGKIGPVTHTGTSTGIITLGGYVIDAYPLVLRVAAPGGLGSMQIEASLDGGLTFDDPLLSIPNEVVNTRWDHEIGITGITLTASSGDYDVGDTWTATTTASQMLVHTCGALSDLYRKWALNTGQRIDDIDEADRTMLAQLGRVWLTAGRGEIPEQWMKLGATAEKYFRLESLGDIRLNAQPVGVEDSLVFPDFERVRRPFTYRYWRH